jgi:hypothetical protein
MTSAPVYVRPAPTRPMTTRLAAPASTIHSLSGSNASRPCPWVGSIGSLTSDVAASIRSEVFRGASIRPHGRLRVGR